ncbi:MAG: hypothetical protein ACTSUC_09585 [Promethearchaeota archaeon]
MPLASPNPNESQDKFINRCMSDETMKREFPDQKQRTAVCFSQWRKKKEISSIKVKAPITKFWEEEVDIEKSVGKIEKSKQRFVEVIVSGLKEDREGEMISQEAIDDMIMQFKSGTIGFFPDHGRDEKTGVSHVYSWKQMMGVWVDSRQENDHLFAVVRLNKAHPDHEMFWEYLEEGMPLGFSIGGRSLEEPIEVEEPAILETKPELEKKKVADKDE